MDGWMDGLMRLVDQTDGGGASQGRFALVFFLVLLAGKNKQVLEIIPLLIGFFTYQIGALAQGFKAIARADEEDA